MRHAIVIPLALISLAHFTQAQTTSTAETVSLETRTVTMPGTLLIPNTLAKNAPVALIIAGSGPTDRNGNSPAGVNANSYKLIAEGLAQAGIASLRYDKLGSGSSLPKITSEADLHFEDYVNDAVAWLEYLKKDQRFKSYYVIGHSEGSLIGILAAQHSQVSGLISLSGAGRNIADVLLEQLKPQLTPAMYTETERVIGALRAGQTVPASSINLPAQVRDSLFRDSVQPYLISWMKYDPTAEIKKLECRVQVLQGDTDLQVKPLDARLLADAAKVKPVILAGVNHVLKNAPLEANANFATYLDPNLPLGTGVLEALTGFIGQ